MKNMRQRKAFTIVEMVIVIAVIAILATVLIPTISGVIKKANISADTQFATSLTIQLAAWEADPANGKIEDPEDLWEVIKEFYGEDFTLEPKSGKYGYHFYYDPVGKQVVLSEYEELYDKLSEPKQMAEDYAVLLSEGNNKPQFGAANPRSLMVKKNDTDVPRNAFLMDQGGSEVVDLIKEIDQIVGYDDYENCLDELKDLLTDRDHSALANALMAKIEQTVIVSSGGAFRFENLDAVDYVYIVPTAGVLCQTQVYVYNGTETEMDENASLASTDVDQIVVPAGVIIDMGGLPAISQGADNESYDGQTELFANVDSVNDLTEVFTKYAMGNVVVLPDGSRYLVELGNIYRLPLERNEEEDITSEPVVSGGMQETVVDELDIVISCPNVNTTPGEDEVCLVGRELYVSYKYLNKALQLKVNNYPVTMFNWRVETSTGEATEAIAVSVNGQIELKKELQVGDKNSFKVIATLPGTDCEGIFTVTVIRPTEVRFTIEENTYSNTDEALKPEEQRYKINLDYRGFDFIISDVFVECNSVVKIEKAASTDVAFSTTGNNLFTLEGNVLKVKKLDNYAGTQELKVTLGDHMTLTFEISVINNATSPVILKQVQGRDIGKLFLFRVGNKNSFNVSDLFNITDTKAALNAETKLTDKNLVLDIYSIAEGGDGDVLVATTGTTKPSNAYLTATITGETWDASKIQFNGTGVARIRLTDAVGRYKDVLVEVVTASNVWAAADATSQNVVLLQDITLSNEMTVTDGYTFYGNGYSITLPTNYVHKVQDYHGYINIGTKATNSSGHLENVKIVGHVFPEAHYLTADGKNKDGKYEYLYNSVKVWSGDSSIKNCYISGSRTNVFVYGGNLLIENTTLSGGSLANMEVAAGLSVTMRNLTTHQTTANGVIGMGILVTSVETQLYFEGDLIQRNWATKQDISTYGKSSFASSVAGLFDGNTYDTFKNNGYMNFGVIYLKDVDVNNLQSLNYDKCNQKDDYKRANVTMKYKDGILEVPVSGAVWTTKGDVAANTNDPGFTAGEYTAVAPEFSFDNSKNNDPDDSNDSEDIFCTYDNVNKVLHIGVKNDAPTKTLNLSGIKITNYNGELITVYDILLNGVKVDGTSVVIDMNNGLKQKLEIQATSDCGYGMNGKPRPGTMVQTNTWTITIEVGSVDMLPPEWNMGGNYTFEAKTNGLYAYYGKSNGYGEAVAIYEGIKIKYYNKSNQLVELNLSGTQAIPTGSNGDNTKEFTYTLADGSVLTMKFSGGWKSGATTHEFTTYNNKVYIYPSQLDNDNYIRAKVANQDFDIKIHYIFTDPNGNSIEQTMRWYNEKASNSKVTTVQWKEFDPTNGKESGGCVTSDTLVTLADGTQKRVDELNGTETLLVWNHLTGTFDTAPVAYIVNHDEAISEHDVLKLVFSDGNYLEIIGEHVFFDKTLNRYVAITADNVDAYMGHVFVSRDEDGLKEVMLVDAENLVRETGVYEVVTYKTITCFTNGILSASAYLDPLLNVFDIDADTLAYDEAQMMEDIATYGLYTYEDFEGLVPEEAFEMYNAAYLKIAVGKGYITWDDILVLIDIYYSNDVTPLQ